MSSCPILNWCTCTADGFCPACKMLLVIGIAALSGMIGYFLGKYGIRKKGLK
ncbi:MAG: hypothetical protein PHS37_10305 [Candidatus Omnitrophica bacterium]|nr:hypothetical protein [Candidatus Omnitrophota bacterium]